MGEDRNKTVDKTQQLVASLCYYVRMEKRNNQLKVQQKGYLRDKRNELIFSLLEPEQGYTYADIAVIFNNLNRSTILRIAKTKPKNYVVKWVKNEEKAFTTPIK